MTRGIATVFLASVFANAAAAHFVFILPPTDGKTASVIFSDIPTKDEKVETKKIEFKTAQVVSTVGKMKSVNVEAEVGGWRVPVGADTAEVRATVEYGVVNRGAGQAIRLWHHARLILSEVAETKPAAPFDITPVKVSSGVAFRVTFNGKPVAGADVTVHEPDAKEHKVLKADATGLTPGFAKAGRYSARAMHIDKTPGEFEGRKYLVTHAHATVTVVVK